MSNQDVFDNKLNKVIQTLGEFDPVGNAWLKIESQLSFEEELDRKVMSLPVSDFKPVIWNNVVRQLTQNHKTKTNTKIKKIILYSFSAAASIILLLGVLTLISENYNTEITYSQEFIVDEGDTGIGVNDLEPLEYLESNCQSLPEICKTPEFLQQKQMLIELNNEHNNLTEVIKKYGESPELIKSLIKVENLKSEIVKELMKAINY